MSKEVLITGSEGPVGKTLTGHTLADSAEKPRLNAAITRVDVRPQRGSDEARDLGEAYNRAGTHDKTNPFIMADLHDDALLEKLLKSHDTVIHAAWGGEGILDPESHNPANLELVERILKVAAGLGALAPKIVFLSSVNAHVPRNWRERQAAGDLIDVDEPPTPHYHNRDGQPGPGFTRYGQTKVRMEEMARRYAEEYSLDITVPRLGAVHLGDRPSSAYPPHVSVASDAERGKHFDLEWEDRVRVAHADLVADMQRIVDRDRQIGHFARYNLVSDNPGRVHKL
jgi:nucleoside-diphosphate-sugar epimerase